MRAFTRLTGLVAATALIAGAANAQTCLGYSSLDAAHMNLTGAVGFMASPSQNGTSFNAELNNRFQAWGHKDFFGVQIGTNSYDAPVNRSSTHIAGSIGVENRTPGQVEWCPAASIGYESGPGPDLSSWQIGAGIGIAKPMSSNGTFALVPFGSLGLSHVRVSLDNCVGGLSCNSSQTAGVFTAGLGFRFNNGAQISPDLTFTTFDNSDPMFAVGVTFPLGGTRSAPPRRR